MTKVIRIFTKHSKCPLIVIPWEKETMDVIVGAMENCCEGAEVTDCLIQIRNPNSDDLVMWASQICMVMSEDSALYSEKFDD